LSERTRIVASGWVSGPRPFFLRPEVGKGDERAPHSTVRSQNMLTGRQSGSCCAAAGMRGRACREYRGHIGPGARPSLSNTGPYSRQTAAGSVDADLHVYEGLAHADYLNYYEMPESEDCFVELNRFLMDILAK